MAAPKGYSVHESIDLGGHMVGLVGSGAMYDTMVNLQSGPRMLGERFEMHALPDNKHPLFDDLSAFSNGFGGDPNNFATLDISKGKYYEFDGRFSRNRQYFDYDLLGNPNIPSGQSIPVSGGDPLPWAQVDQSPFLFNTVRRMTDTHLTILPESRVTFHAGYSQKIFQGPSLTPSGYLDIRGIINNSVLLQQMQRFSTDTFTGGVDWKPVRDTKLTFEEEIDHIKQNAYMVMDPTYLRVQEADGTKVALLADYFELTPYDPAAECNTNSMGSSPALSAPQMPGGLPVINAACAVMSSYVRYQPTRILYPTEIFRFQTSSIKNVQMNGDVRYTSANMSLPDYYENFQGLTAASATSGALRAFTQTGQAKANREAIVADYGIVWQASKKISFTEQIRFSNVHQPGTTTMTSATALMTPATAGDKTISYGGPLTSTAIATTPGSGAVGVPDHAFFGQKFVVNNFTTTWDASSRATLALTYRHSLHTIAEGIPHDAPLAPGATSDGTVTINEDGGIFHAALRPAANWNVNGTLGILYSDNVFTPMGPRQEKLYRLHSLYRPKSWATVSVAFNDRERHNNTNNTGTPSADGPLEHESHTRSISLGTELFPNEHYGWNFNYTYTDVYMSDNICYLADASPTLPGAATASGTACPDGTVRGASYYMFGPTKDFMDAPTNTGSVALTLSPNKKLTTNIGYNISSVNGSRFYNDARDVAGSLVSTYQSPFADVRWTVHPGLIWKADYNFYGYGEGRPSGAQYCSTSNPTPGSPAPVVPCDSASLAGLQTGMTISPAGETAPRNYHANIVTLGVHYEF